MKRSIIILTIFITTILFLTPVIANAKTEKLNSFFYIAVDQKCENDNSVLGNVECEDSVAWLLQKILDYTKIVGPALVVVFSGIDFAKVIIQSDDDAMAKAKKKLITRLILAGCLFFIPTVVSIVLNIFGITSETTSTIR